MAGNQFDHGDILAIKVAPFLALVFCDFSIFCLIRNNRYAKLNYDFIFTDLVGLGGQMRTTKRRQD